MCPRNYKSSLDTHPALVEAEMGIDELREALTHPWFADVNNVLINGNYGDIVMHSDPRGLIEMLKSLPNMKTINIYTNGGAQSTEFWSWLGKQGVYVEFGIDGLETTHHLYRRNTRWDIVMRNAEAYIQAGGYAGWSMIVFRHNEHQVVRCQRLAKVMGFAQFKAKPTTRFSGPSLPVLDRNYEVEYELEPATVLKHTSSATTETDCIRCKVQQDPAHCYIAHDMRLWPCCWMQIHTEVAHRNNQNPSFVEHFWNQRVLDPEFNSLRKYSVDEVLASGLFNDIATSWSGQAFDACVRFCSADSRMNQQYEQTNTKVF
jgi:MoaA/NifB/PqqE/SkfB family radical SAM enzyme